MLIAAWTPLSAQRTIDLDQATIADINAAFAKGTLTSERLTQIFLSRIDAYDRKGPALRAVITLNPKALETARAMDAERKTKGPRSPLHGIPIVLKDNIDTADCRPPAVRCCSKARCLRTMRSWSRSCARPAR